MEVNMDNIKERRKIKRYINFFLQQSDLSTYELAEKFGLNVTDLDMQILEGSDKNDGI